eukprot:scaffold664937_cov67-Prasinocladus_malaysianus.AAC.1
MARLKTVQRILGPRRVVVTVPMTVRKHNVMYARPHMKWLDDGRCADLNTRITLPIQNLADGFSEHLPA